MDVEELLRKARESRHLFGRYDDGGDVLLRAQRLEESARGRGNVLSEALSALPFNAAQLVRDEVRVPRFCCACRSCCRASLCLARLLLVRCT